MALNDQEKLLVENHLYLVHQVLVNSITPNNSIPGMGYDDLYQTGCEALCKAAATYNANKNSLFKTYAKSVIRNHIYDCCRHVCYIQSNLLYLDAPANEHNKGQSKEFRTTDSIYEQQDNEIIPLLYTLREEYSGICAKGVNALLLKCSGYSGIEIASRYQVKPNHIAAWISRASSKLRQDRRVLAAFNKLGD